MATHPKKVQIKRTQIANNPPVGLLPGELSVEMNDPLRLWVGVPASINVDQRRLLIDATSGYVSRGGDTMTGSLTIKPPVINPQLILNKATPANTNEITGQLLDQNRWKVILGTGESETGANAGTDFSLLSFDDTGAALHNVLDFTRSTGLGTVRADPTAPLGIATKQYVDAIGGAGVLYIPQVKTEAEQTIARQNIYAASFDAMADRNMHYNGGMEVAQEYGTTNVQINAGAPSKVVIDGYTVQLGGAPTGVMNAQQQPCGAITVGANAFFTKMMMLNCAATPFTTMPAGDFIAVRISMEGTRVSRLGWGTAAGKPLTVSFWINPQVAGTMAVTATNNAGDRCYPVDVPLVAGWQYKTVTIPAPPSGTWLTDTSLGIYIWLTFGAGANWQAAPGVWSSPASTRIGTANTTNFFSAANQTISITGVGVWPGSEAPSADHSGLVTRTLDENLRICQRYFAKSFPIAVVPAALGGLNGSMVAFMATTSANTGGTVARFPVAMRATPTINTLNPNFANNFWYDTNAATSRTVAVADVCDVSVRLLVSEAAAAGSQHLIQWTARAQL